jgi:phage tail protein X
VFGDQHPEYAHTLTLLAAALELQGRLEESQRLLEQGLRIARPHLTDEHWRVLEYATSLARVRIARSDAAATEPSLRQVLKAREQLYPAGDWRIGQTQSLLGAALMARHRYAEAEPLMVAAEAVLKPIPGAQARERVANRARLVSLYLASGRPHLADIYR